MRRPAVYDFPGLAFLLRDLRHMKAQAAPMLEAYLIWLDLEGKAARTLYAYHRELARLLRAYPDHRIEDFTAAEVSALLQQVPKRSRHISRSIYNKFFEWALLMGHIQTSPMFQVPKVKHPPRLNRDIFTLAEVAQLEALPSPDGCLFAILFGSGIRRAEARRLRSENVDLGRRRLAVLGGKGGKDRVVALTKSWDSGVTSREAAILALGLDAVLDYERVKTFYTRYGNALERTYAEAVDGRIGDPGEPDVVTRLGGFEFCAQASTKNSAGDAAQRGKVPPGHVVQVTGALRPGRISGRDFLKLHGIDRPDRAASECDIKAAHAAADR